MVEKREVDGDYLDAFHKQLEHPNEIYVWDIVDGKYGKYPFSALSIEKRMAHIREWVKERLIPLRIVSEKKSNIE